MLKTPSNFTSLLEAVPGFTPCTLVFRGDEVLVDGSTLTSGEGEHSHPVVVGALNEILYQAISVGQEYTVPPGSEFRKIRSLLGFLDEDLLGIVGRGYQLAEWRRTHRYCGACGAETILVSGDRSMKCSSCAMSFYPRISPAMMVLIRKEHQILLCRHTRYTTNRYTALAGFVEPGESIEECVHREVFEEVGLKITDLKYFGSQSWPFPNSLMIAFTAEYLSGELSLDLSEINDARWYGPEDALPEIPAEYSIAGHLIRSCRELTAGLRSP